MLSKVIVVLVNYNSYQDTKECILSIKEHENNPPYIIVVDNNSSNSQQLDELNRLYENLHIIYNTNNIGFGKANNIGIQWAFEKLHFKYLLLLNNDTVISEDAISKLTVPFKNNSHIGVTTSKITYNYNREIIWYGGGEINYRRGWPKITDFNHKPSKEGANKPGYVTFVSGCVMMFSRKCIEDVKGFDDDFFMYCEDLELSMRLARKGYKLWYEPTSIIFHKVQGSTKKGENAITGLNSKNPNLSFLFYHMKSNQWIAMKKNLELKQFLVFNIFYWLELTYLSIKLVIEGRVDMVKTVFKTSKRVVENI